MTEQLMKTSEDKCVVKITEVVIFNYYNYRGLVLCIESVTMKLEVATV